MTAANTPPPDDVKSVIAFIAGYAAISALTFATDRVLHLLEVYPEGHYLFREQRLNLMALTYRMIYTIVGGYIAARLAPRNPMIHALVLGLFETAHHGAGAIIALSMADQEHNWYPIALALIATPGAWLGAVCHRWRHGDFSGATSPGKLDSGAVPPGKSTLTPPSKFPFYASYYPCLTRLLKSRSGETLTVFAVLHEDTYKSGPGGNSYDLWNVFATKEDADLAINRDLEAGSDAYRAFTRHHLREMSVTLRGTELDFAIVYSDPVDSFLDALYASFSAEDVMRILEARY